VLENKQHFPLLEVVDRFVVPHSSRKLSSAEYPNAKAECLNLDWRELREDYRDLTVTDFNW
tara:strand:- start:619 stop:801 length:183 start_codon:yes stop_codon:yes gene_type:complete